MRITLYLDEDSQDSDLVQALRLREVDVFTAKEAGMNGCEDEEQLDHAATQERVLYSFNVRDFYRLHTQYIVQGKPHAGIILAPQQQFSVGEQTRRLLKLISVKPAEAMRNQIEFLSHWN